MQFAFAIALQNGVGGSYLWDLADVTTYCRLLADSCLSHQNNKTCSVSSTISPLDKQTLCTMKVLPQSQQPTSSSSSFGRQNVVKGNFDFIFLTAQTHGFQKTVMFSRESLCSSFALTISLHILQPADAVIHQDTVLEGGSSLVAYAHQAALPRAGERENLIQHS